MIGPNNGKNRPTDTAGAGVTPVIDKVDFTAPGLPIDDLHAAIQELIGLFDIASDLARRGEQVNIDLLAMRVAVLCDAVCDADPAIGRPFQGDLEALLGHLDMLEGTLLRERVQLALSVEAADRRQRAKAAYGRVLPSMTTALPGLPKNSGNQSHDDRPLDDQSSE